VILVLAGAATIPFFGGGFLPELNEGHFIVHMAAVPGTSMQESLRIGREVTLALMKNPHVRSVSQRVGRAERGDDFLGPHNSEFEVDLKPLTGDEAETVQAEIRNALVEFPGVNFSLNAFLTERVEETLSGYAAPVAVNIYGRDLDVLDAKAKEVVRALGAVPGAVEVQVQSPPGAPQLVVQLRKGDLERWGLQPVDVLDDIGAAFQGEVVGQVYDGNRVFDVAVILAARSRQSIEQVGGLLLRNSSGTYVPLQAVADIYEGSGRYAIFHQGARRLQTVTCAVAGRDMNSFIADAKSQIQAKVDLPSGTYVEFAGTAQAGNQARRDLIVHSLIAGIGILLLLSVVMGTWRNLLLVLANLPFALVGGVLAVFASGGWLTIGSMVGFVTLFGITLRNSILMISHYEHLVSDEGMTWGLDTAIRGASERLAPILMTAAVTGLGLLPLAIGSGEPGREIEGPMAMVILGGLATSTVLNLVVLPTLALRYGRFVHTEISTASKLRSAK
jgi:Cu/Ag efflux pump CusA